MHALNAAELSDDTELWRYMALGPFLAMLTSQALYQTRVDAFEDASEGAYGYKNAELIAVATALRMEARAYSDNEGDYLLPPRKEEIIRAARASTAVTCWFRHSVHESFPMWRIYARDTFGVAVVTTLGALRQVFEGAENVRIGGVAYEPLPAAVRDVHTLFFHKRAEYSDEREIRSVNVVEQPFTDRYPSISMSPATMDLLIRRVVAAPSMHNTMFKSLLKIIQTQFSLEGLIFDPDRLCHSTLDGDLV